MNAVEKQECIPVGCVPSAVVAVLGWGVCLGRRCLPLGDSAWEVSTWGCLPGGVLHLDPEADTSTLWTEFLTHACENITFLQLLLRTVIMMFSSYLLIFRIYFEGRGMCFHIDLPNRTEVSLHPD